MTHFSTFCSPAWRADLERTNKLLCRADACEILPPQIF